MTEIEKLQQQVEDLKTRLDGQKKTNATLKKRAFKALVKGRSFEAPEVQGQIHTDQSIHLKNNFLEP